MAVLRFESPLHCTERKRWLQLFGRFHLYLNNDRSLGDRWLNCIDSDDNGEFDDKSDSDAMMRMIMVVMMMVVVMVHMMRV